MKDGLARAALALSRWSDRVLPSALGIAALLTLLTFLLAGLFGYRDVPPLERALRMASGWGAGLSGLLSFAMQMCLVMLTGHIVAESPPFRRGLDALARVPRGPRSAVAWLGFVSMLLGLLNWGVSLIGSAVLTRAIARRRPDVDYRLLVAAAYLGMGCTWHAGLSASGPLAVAARPNDFVSAGFIAAPVPAAQTLGSPLNLGLAAMAVVSMTALVALLHPSPRETLPADPAWLAEPEAEAPAAGGAIDGTAFVPWLLALAAAAYLAGLFRQRGAAALDINAVNVGFLALGLALHGSLRSFGHAAARGAGYLHGIIIQFPLYAGIGAVIKDSGLAARIADLVVGHASPSSLPLLVYWYSGVVNYFVPSGGSKLAIEAPYLFPAAERLGVAPASMVLAYAWGDMMTDIIQPFWAIPLLGVARLDFRAIAGYCAIIFLVYAGLVSAAFALAY